MHAHIHVWCCDPVHYCSGPVKFLCQDDPEHWGHNCFFLFFFKKPIQRLRDSGQVCMGTRRSVKHTGLKTKRNTELHSCRSSSPEINQKKHPHRKTAHLLFLHWFYIKHTFSSYRTLHDAPHTLTCMFCALISSSSSAWLHQLSIIIWLSWHLNWSTKGLCFIVINNS